jgi:soluble lytic murein transglycosylase-like protein
VTTAGRPAALAIGVLMLLGASAVPARAELVFFASGRAMSVRAVRTEGDQLALQLRSGGVIFCDPALIVRVAPDEIPYPDEVPEVAAAPTIPALGAVPEDFRELIQTTAARHGVDPVLVSALIQVESAFHSGAISPKGARGLMQIMPSTGRQYGALDLLDPAVNIEAGVRHLKRLLTRYDLPQALAAYNAGEGAVDRFGGIPPFSETRNYVSRVLHLIGQS